MNIKAAHSVLNFSLPNRSSALLNCEKDVGPSIPPIHEMISNIKTFSKYTFTINDTQIDNTMVLFYSKLTAIGEGLNSLKEAWKIKSSWSYVCHMIKDNIKEDANSQGWMCVPWIKEFHYNLMETLIDENIHTGAGKFSFAPRSAVYNNHEHFYPHFQNEKDWFNAIQPFLDIYNPLIQHAKENGSIIDICKCAGYLLFHIISLHPFSDGNGRLSRMLASYTLSLLCPFPCAIFNILDPTKSFDFVESIIWARNNKHPISNEADISNLVALIIESLWFSYIIYFANLIMSTDTNLDHCKYKPE